MQTAHEGQIVFSTAVIPRKNADEAALTDTLTVGKPLYYRAFFPKTAAAMFNAARLKCTPDEMTRRLVLRRTGDKVSIYKGAEVASPNVGDVVNNWSASTHVYRQQMLTVFKDVRTATFAVDDKVVPFVLGAPTVIDHPENEEVLYSTIDFIAKLPAAPSSIDVEMCFGCDMGAQGWVGILGSKGTLKVDFKAGERNKLTSFYKVKPGNAANTKRMRKVVLAKFNKDEKLLDFAVYDEKVYPLEKKEWVMALTFKASDGKCKHAMGTITEDYLGGGKYGKAHYVIGDGSEPTLLPCDAK